ncbi:MFS transporter [Dyella monticola]|uniref:MFS transporter n=1 Tax=Dyella monticola TaxID=1927958 RepID=A0A370WXH4_9GAMM|nr:DHA2 family efflux MFS transporter permease subunit [Dyella monticola]RDS80848.1 MFS transporter [Dyella monticola]
MQQTADPANSNQSSLFYAVFFYVAPAMFIGTLDQTIVASALPTISTKLGGFGNIAWVVTAYMLAATVAAPLYGKLGDALGRRRALLWAVAVFTAGSILCALSPDLNVLIVARAAQGLGGGGLMTLSLALIGEAVSPRERGRFQGWFGAVFALASSIGPVAGGTLTELWGWRSIFWINVPLGAIATYGTLRLQSRSGLVRFKFDPYGTLTFVIATVSLLLTFDAGPKVGWTSFNTLSLLVVALVSYAALWKIERVAKDPLINLDLLADPVLWRSAVCVLLYAVMFFAAIVGLPLLLQLVLSMSPSGSGLMLIPLTLAQVVVSTITGYRISATGRPRAPMTLGLFVATLGFLLMALFLGEGAFAICLASALFGLGLGTTMPAAQTLAQWTAGSQQLGAAVAMVTFARSVGGTLGAALAGALLTAALRSNNPALVSSIENALVTSGTHITLTPIQSSQIAHAFRFVFGSLALIAFVASCIARTLPNVDLAASPARIGTIPGSSS